MSSSQWRQLPITTLTASQKQVSSEVVDAGAYTTLEIQARVLKAGGAGNMSLEHAAVNEPDAFTAAALGLRMVGEVPYFEEHWPASSEDWSASVTESQWYQTTFRRTFTHQDAVDGYKPYAHSDLRMGLACGGWVSSAYDIALFLRDLFVGPSVVLSEDTITHMALQHATYTASGYDRGQTLSGLDWSSSDGFAKNGHLPGSHAYVRHLASPRTQGSTHTGDGGLGGLGDADDGSAAGASVVFLFNRYFDDAADPPLRSRLHDIEATVVDLLKDITDWGSDDAFES